LFGFDLLFAVTVLTVVWVVLQKTTAVLKFGDICREF